VKLSICHLGPTPYGEGLDIQERLVAARAAGETGDWLLFPDHPPVLTVGRGGSDGSLIADAAALAARGIERFEVTRGGDVTWHGPGQLVGYPIVDLSGHGRDLHRYLRGLEDVVIATLAAWDIAAERSAGRTGVWVGERKIASIGIAVRRWVGYHGFALNVAPDLSDFDLIHPCGLRGVRMTSMLELLGPSTPDLSDVRRRSALELAQRFGYQDSEWRSASEVRAFTRHVSAA